MKLKDTLFERLESVKVKAAETRTYMIENDFLSEKFGWSFAGITKESISKAKKFLI